MKSSGKEAFSLLIVDDELGIQDFLKRALSKKYSLVEVASSAEEAEKLRAEYHFDLMIVDICLPGRSGIDWLNSIDHHNSQSDVIFMTAFSNIDNAISALRVGAFDFILKPFRLEEMVVSVDRCLERRRLERENFVLKRQVNKLYFSEGMIGNSPQLRELCQLITRVAPTPSLVLIEGETGTGKELVANAIHRESKRIGPFVPVNCGAIAPELIETEFFGHKKGAFTNASQAREGLFLYANGGTLFLDEIGEMPLPLQAKILRVLEEQFIRPVGSEREIPINVRVVAATNRDLKQDVVDGRFREDLFYRLNVMIIRVPPLRERKPDVLPLLHHYSRELAGQLALPEIPFSHEEIQQLEDYDWPGNVRELKNLVERCLLLGRLPAEILNSNTDKNNGAIGYPDSWPIGKVEKEHYLKVLDYMRGNKTQAAKILGVSRKTLERKLHFWSDNHADD